MAENKKMAAMAEMCGSGCGQNTNNTYAINCEKCTKWFHAKCVNMTIANLNNYQKELKNPRGKRWKCTPCEKSEVKQYNVPEVPEKKEKNNELTLLDVMNKLESIENKYTEVLKLYEDQARVNQELRKEIEMLKLKQNNENNGPKCDQSEVLNELTDRERRKNNLMIFGCIETDDEDKKETEIQVREIIKSVCPEVDTTLITTHRVGKPQKDRPRPLKVNLRTHKDVRNVFFKARELRKIPAYSKIFLSMDKTPKQIQEYKSLKSIMLQRMENGEENLRIKYFKDVPRIITVSNMPKN